MSAYPRLRHRVVAVSTDENITESAAAMWVMVVEAMALAAFVPVGLRQALVDAADRWYLRSSEAPLLEPWRVASWRFLQAKYGNSTTVLDSTDITVRAMICVLSDEEPTTDDIAMTLDYFASLLDRCDLDFSSAARGDPPSSDSL